MVTVTGGRPAGLAIELAVGDSNIAASLHVNTHSFLQKSILLTSFVSGDEHLTTDQGNLHVVNPNLVRAVQSDGIATPDVLRV